MKKNDGPNRLTLQEYLSVVDEIRAMREEILSTRPTCGFLAAKLAVALRLPLNAHHIGTAAKAAGLKWYPKSLRRKRAFLHREEKLEYLAGKVEELCAALGVAFALPSAADAEGNGVEL